MPRNKPRCDFKLQTWVPEEFAEAIERAAREQLLDVSDVLRQAIVLYLRSFNIMPPSRMNGHHHKPGAEHTAVRQNP
jgi:hypothetical protein